MVELDRFLPNPHWHTRHAGIIPASPEIARQAFDELTVGELKLTAVLWGLRMLPARLFQPGQGSFMAGETTVWNAMGDMGFMVLARIEHGSATLGFIGQPWQLCLSQAVRRDIQPEQFTDFGEPNYIKGLTGVVIRPHPRGSLMLTETRVFATNSAAKRRFQTYWNLIHPFSNVIRRDMLAGVRRRAVRMRNRRGSVTKL